VVGRSFQQFVYDDGCYIALFLIQADGIGQDIFGACSS
jgi:hypothetical protein